MVVQQQLAFLGCDNNVLSIALFRAASTQISAGFK